MERGKERMTKKGGTWKNDKELTEGKWRGSVKTSS